MLKLIPVNIKKDLRAAIKEATINASKEGDQRFLCEHDGVLFVNTISLAKNIEIPSNCKEGVLYVDCVARRVIVPIHQLDSLYYIENGDYE